MALSPGDKLGPYEILALVGKGGMGEVYRAHDSRLNRDVAIKVSNAQFTERFTSEARTIASLNHTNICHLYDVGPNYLVMEYVEGQDLRGPLDFEDALPIIQQLIDGIEAAHEKNIIHRDLKPGNIKITPEGVVKILDFGLAKAMEPPPSDDGNPENSPTLTIGATQAGTILGTAAYMAPEQAKGKQADKRSDIWSFGVILYEVLTGKKLFVGETAVEILGGVLNKDPDISAAPLRVHRLLRWCLEKDRKNRLQAIGDARRLLQEPESEVTAFVPSKWKLSAMAWSVAALLAVVAAGASWIAWRATRPVEHPLIRLNVDMGPDFFGSATFMAAISPDGTRIAYQVRDSNGKTALATRLLNQPDGVPIQGTENGRSPFFSPDGQWIGFSAGGKLQKVPVQGGAPTTVCDCGNGAFLGASWGDGTIITSLSGQGGLVRVPENGGIPQPFTQRTSGEITHRWPQVLPAGKSVVFTASNRSIQFEKATVQAVSLQTGERKVLVSDAYYGRYVPSNGSTGHLIYMHEGALYAVAFDPERLNPLGKPVALLEDVGGVVGTGSAWFAFSNTGTLLYRNGSPLGVMRTIEWLDGSGKRETLLAKPGRYDTPRFSPDGQRLAFRDDSAKGADIYVYDLQRDVITRITFTGEDEAPLWAPDGKHIVFESRPAAGSALWWIRADGAGEPQKLLESSNRLMTVSSFSPDGHRLAYFYPREQTQNDLWTVALDLADPEHPKVGKPELFLGTPAQELDPAFAPDGHWMAYVSDESGNAEVYVRRAAAGAADAGGKWQISTGGGSTPRWSRDGRELFYEQQEPRTIMVVEYTASSDSFLPGKPHVWAKSTIFNPSNAFNIDLHPDGKRFAVFSTPPSSVHMTFLLNFFDELRRRVPAGK